MKSLDYRLLYESSAGGGTATIELPCSQKDSASGASMTLRNGCARRGAMTMST